MLHWRNEGLGASTKIRRKGPESLVRSIPWHVSIQTGLDKRPMQTHRCHISSITTTCMQARRRVELRQVARALEGGWQGSNEADHFETPRKRLQAYPHSYTHAGCRELLWALHFTIASDSRNSRRTPPDRFVEPRLTEPTIPPPSFPQKKASHWLSAISSLAISCNFLALMPKCQFGHRPFGHPTQTDGRIQEVIRLMLPANLWVLGPMGKLAVQSVGLQDSVSCCA